MSQLYPLTKQINDLLPKVTETHQLNIWSDLKYFINAKGLIFHKVDIESWGGKLSDYIPLIQAPQIRQILLALKDVLEDKIYTNPVNYNNIDNADDLCSKWLDGLTPLIDSSPETVLSELVEVLENLLND